MLDVSVLGFGDNVVDVYEHIRTKFPGGNAVNFAVYAKKSGVKRSAYMGYFGSDENAEHVIKSLQEEQIELYKCKQLLGENGYSCVSIAEDGDRLWGDYNQGGIRGETSFVLDRFDLEYMAGFDVVHTGNYCFTERQLPKMHAANIAVSFDFSDDSTDEYFDTWAPFVTYAAFSASDMSEADMKKRMEHLIELGPKWVLASRGVEGAWGYDGTNWYRQESVPVTEMKDAMGAGDSFITTFLVNYLDQLKQGTADADAKRFALNAAAHFASEVCCVCDGSWGHPLRY